MFESYFGSALTPTEHRIESAADPSGKPKSGTPRSANRIAHARVHFEAAAALGHGKSLRKLAVMDASGMTSELAKPQQSYASTSLTPSSSSSSSSSSPSSSASSSLALYHLAAVHGDTEAQLALAHRYHKGIGGAEYDCETAAFYYMAVADKSSVESTMGGAETVHDHVLLTAKAEDAGIDKGEKGEDDELIAYQRLRAEEGHVPSIMAMGDLYYYGGHGLARDQAQALQYFQQAAGAPHFNDAAEVAVGNLFLKGEGTKANLTTAMNFYEKAAAKNNTRALNGLDGVADCHDVHVWELTAGKPILSCHMICAETTRDPDAVLKAAQALCAAHGIDHATIQIQTGGDCLSTTCCASYIPPAGVELV